MGKFNTKIVESLDFLNKVLAGIFVFLSVYRFIEMVGDSAASALFELFTILGLGILTCGYIALMINIKDLLQRILDKQN